MSYETMSKKLIVKYLRKLNFSYKKFSVFIVNPNKSDEELT